MAADLPEALQDLIDRILPAPAPGPADPADGALGRLHAWWEARAGAAAFHPQAVAVRPPDAAVMGSDDPEPRIPKAIAQGAAAADRAIDSGSTMLVLATSTPLTSARSTTARAAISLIARREASSLLPQPAGLSDRSWMSLCAGIRDAAAGGLVHRGDVLAALSSLHADDLAFAVGVLLAAAARRTACLLDGVEPLAAAVVAHRLAYRSRGWWLAASDSPDPGRTCAIERVDLPIALPLGVADDRGAAVTAVLALLPTLLADPADA